MFFTKYCLVERRAYGMLSHTGNIWSFRHRFQIWAHYSTFLQHQRLSSTLAGFHRLQNLQGGASTTVRCPQPPDFERILSSIRQAPIGSRPWEPGRVPTVFRSCSTRQAPMGSRPWNEAFSIQGSSRGFHTMQWGYLPPRQIPMAFRPCKGAIQH